ncbi:MAG: hypothetical protein ACE5HE_05185 [Phycisphaerae bacterium]
MSRKMKITPQELVKIFAAFCAVGTLLASSCDVRGIRAVEVGLDAATTYLDEQDAGRNNDISFGDWLLSELED